MFIKPLTPLELDDASYLIYEIIRNKENITPNLPTSYSEIYTHLNKIINHSTDLVLGAFKNDKLVAVTMILVDSKNKRLIYIGGPFAKEKYDEIFNKFADYLKSNYASFKFTFSYYDFNEKYIQYLIKFGAKEYYREDIYQYIYIDKNEEINKKIHLLEYDEYELFSEIYNNAKNFWNSNKILSSLSYFDVFMYGDEGKGYIVVNKSKVPYEIVDYDATNKKIKSDLVKAVTTLEEQNLLMRSINEETSKLLIENGFKKEVSIHYFKKEF